VTAKLFPPGVPKRKRLFDLVITIPVIILISPILTLVALAMLIAHGPPILFSQTRAGYRGEIFTLFKFRSMTNKRDEDGNLLPDKMRLTLFGEILRATSIDELPELFNILRGEMSWVGPRPLLVRYLERYTPEQNRRHKVLPGLTGWAQINGRNIISWESRFELDVWYVDNWSLWLDIKILFITVWKVITREGINQPGAATMHEFRGTEEE
jgi:lipopolysaccharide/colanic/teichoic acid biosynthesis glycosyltransferase